MRSIAIGYRQNLPIEDESAFVAEEVEVPELGAHDLLVEVQAVSVNPLDVRLRSTVAPDGFRVLGFDGAGVVRQMGPRVSDFVVGDEVFYSGSPVRQGTNQRLHVVDARVVGPKPPSVNMADAASLPLTALTAWECLFDRLGLGPESEGTLLVVGATGGVGAVLLQIVECKLPGVTVIATASDDERASWVRELGADHVVNHHQDLAQQVKDIAPDGVDWIYTAYSEDQLELYAEVTRPFGAIVAIDNGPRDVFPLKWKSISWHWEFMGARTQFQTPDMAEQGRVLQELSAMVEAGQIRPTTSKVLSPINVENLREAHRLVGTRRTKGKIVLHGW